MSGMDLTSASSTMAVPTTTKTSDRLEPKVRVQSRVSWALIPMMSCMMNSLAPTLTA